MSELGVLCLIFDKKKFLYLISELGVLMSELGVLYV